MRRLIDNVTLFTGANWVPDACVHIDGAHIVYAGPRAGAPELSLADQPAERIDGRGGVLMPGLANAHTHLSMTLLRGVGSDQVLQDWLQNDVWPAEERLTPAFTRVGAELGLLEHLRFGVTAFADQYFYMDAVAEAVIESGARALLTRGLIAFGDNGERLAENVALFKEYHGAAEGRIRVGLGTHGEYTNTDQSIRAHVEAARDLGAMIHVHIAETRAEAEGCKNRHGGRSVVRYLADMGLLDIPTLAAHCVWVDEADIDLLAEKGVAVAHNPVSNLKLASGVMPLPRMLEKGVRVSLGTDGAASNNNLNLWEEVKLTGILHKGVSGDPTLIAPPQVLAMATVNGVRAMGFGEVGMLLPGWRADMILLEAGLPHRTPCVDPAADLVYSAQGADVRMTMVDGRVLYLDGEYLTLDRERIVAEAKKAADVMIHGG
ncbi:MAG: amidohydrolase [Clostridia bacterium]|nr:amidohydrolase [Clostridia bacterium]